MGKRKKIGSRIIAVILCMAIFVSQVNIVEASSAETSPESENSQVLFPNDVAEPSTENSEVSSQSVEESSTEEAITEEQKNTESQSEAETDSSDDTSENSSTDNLESYYKDGKICIYNYKQVLQIGTDAVLYTGDKDGNIGSGEAVKTEGDEVTYGLDRQYVLMNDIKMDPDQEWNFPEEFTGTFSSDQDRTDTTIYDSATDTIYIYNRYQMALMYSENAENEMVMSEDYQAERVGMGQAFTLEDGSHLTYGASHNYVLASGFTQETPDLIANKEATISVNDAYPTEYEGRDYFGQVVKTIGNKDYILIGNEKQLRAIGTDVEVTEPIWRVYETRKVHYTSIGTPWGHTDWTPSENDGEYTTELYYPGDADLVDFGDYDWSDKELYANDQGTHKIGDKENLDNKLDTEALKRYVYVGSSLSKEETDTEGNVTQTAGLLTYATDATSNKLNIASGTHKYSNDANYIIFRNIDLNSKSWTPMMLSGDMIGSKATGQSTLWNNDASVTNYSKATDFSSNVERPVISNITVNQTEKMDGSKYIGIGFFATVTNEINVADIGVSAGTVTVSNIELQNVSVQNNTNTHKNTQTLISGLTSSLGWLVGGLVDLLVGALTFGQVKLNLRDTLSALLNARAEDPTIYATGAFAGRLVGDVLIENCDVTGDVQVSNINSRTGGFVGYTEGVTQYSGLSTVLGTTVDALSSLLNIIPGLGLGDLITILLKKALPVSELIPTGYKNVTIKS